MWNLIRATARQALRNKILLGMVVFMLLMSLAGTGIVSESGSNQSASQYAGNWFSSVSGFLSILSGVVVGVVCGGDLDDKTANYEILYGKKRSQVYFSRVLVAFVFALIAALLLITLPLLFLTAKNGWGGSLTVQNAVLHGVMMFPAFCRMLCFFIALTFISTSMLPAFAAGFLKTLPLMFVNMMLELSGTDFRVTWQTALNDLIRLQDFSNYTTGMFEGAEIGIYKAELTREVITQSLLCSVGFGLFWLLLGFFVFRKKDLK